MKLLITGGSGFIGSNFIRLILRDARDIKITNIDKLTYAGNQSNLKEARTHPAYAFIKGDICDESLLKEILPRHDAIINFAAESHVDRSIQHPHDFIKTNIVGVFNLLHIAHKCGIKKIVHVGTDEVYGQLEKHEDPKTENDAVRPRNPYSGSKASADLLAMSFFHTYGLPVMITRSSNNYGPFQYPEKLIPLFITNLLENKQVPLMGKGENVRDWIHVEDNCRAIYLVLNKGKPGNIYNIAGECQKTNLEITTAILRMLKKEKTWIKEIPHRPGHDFRYAMDCKKIKNLGWRQQIGFEEGIKKTIEWYKENQDWWKELKNK
jgi:dTDP-glucose 4,6-dehydratase